MDKPKRLGDLLSDLIPGDTLAERTEAVIDSLTDREKDILRKRFERNPADPVHYKDRLNEGPDQAVCGSDLEPLISTSLFGQPFTFDIDKVTCERCLSWYAALMPPGRKQ